jgi:dihydroorotate dehydrogenase electron transfer subunit
MNMEKHQKIATLIANHNIQGDYYRAVFQVEDMPHLAKPGQFIHLLLPDFQHHVLRRPFSIYDTAPAQNQLSIIYKVVGDGTARLSSLAPCTKIDLLGPLGTPFSPLPQNSVIVAGGYGCAATFLAAKLACTKPAVLIGGRSKVDILLREEYENLGCKVLVSTDDGSEGTKGLVTSLLPQIPKIDWLISCGPIPLLRALSGIMEQRRISGELSMDKAMCCGVGACFACVTKVKADTPDGWRYARVCKEGPVFSADQLIWD